MPVNFNVLQLITGFFLSIFMHACPQRKYSISHRTEITRTGVQKAIRLHHWTGLGFTFDVHNIIDLTKESPVAASTKPGNFYAFRYYH